ncbi:1-phosphofructokinase family hexose kinase [Phenylobacterium sp.]|uniref:1-phosphofructokinase family hexose kinase n=1 Tax=Phenylobacterium sp. TaxID=1871053 RepID=UPI0035B2A02A
MQTKADVVTLTANPALDIATSVAKVESVNKLRCEAPRFDPGGGGINVARVVHRLGGSTLAVFPSGGPTGQRLAGLLQDAGVPTRPIAVAEDTRESFNITDRGDGAEYRFILPGPHLTEAELGQCLDAALDAAHAGGFLVVSGSLPPGAPTTVIGDLARRAKAAGLRLVVDTWGPTLAAALEAGVHLIKPNLRELSDHLDRALPDMDTRMAACRELIAAGRTEMVALSLSEQGAMLVTAEEAWSVPAAPIKPASTVGAGDSFLAGLVWALGQGREPRDALRFAAASGAATLLSPGTELCHRDDVFRLVEQIEPSRLG